MYNPRRDMSRTSLDIANLLINVGGCSSRREMLNWKPGKKDEAAMLNLCIHENFTTRNDDN